MKIASNGNENSRQFVDMGMDVGDTDLRLSYRGSNNIYTMLYLELKKKKGKLLPSQIEWNEDFDRNYVSSNCQRAVAYGYEEAQRIIADWFAKAR